MCFYSAAERPIVLIAPCKHALFCRTCLQKLCECPQCRTKITKLLELDSDEARAALADGVTARTAEWRPPPPPPAKRAKTQHAATSRITGFFIPRGDAGSDTAAAAASAAAAPVTRIAAPAAARAVPSTARAPLPMARAAPGVSGGKRTLVTMLRDGTLHAGEAVVRCKMNRSRLGNLRADGRLILPGVGLYDSPSAFAKAVKGVNVSGPTNVEVKLPNGSWKTLKNLGYS